MTPLPWLGLLATALAQKPGTQVVESHPELPLWTCDASGCVKEMKTAVLDANWRWVHNGQYKNCYKDGDWDKDLCPDPKTCASNCYLEGISEDQYGKTYGVTRIDDGMKLNFVTKTQYGSNFGSRIYMLDDSDSYKIFKLKNREFSLTVDMFYMPCGLNGAVYFVEMDRDGGVSRSGGSNRAGAKYGTGYCDAQCPHDIKFMNGRANVLNWNASHDPPIGQWGSCCQEMDIWEANSRATAYTPHPCSIEGQYVCDGLDCGDTRKGQRYDGVCDKDGCDFNSWRLGVRNFYGRGHTFDINSRKPVTVVTQFITEGNADDGGALVDIRRFYVQDGQVIPNSNVSVAGFSGNSISDKLCAKMKKTFGDIDDFDRKGGLKTMGDALARGMVLVLSLWDDSQANMLWLDSDYPSDRKSSAPGVSRGPCRTDTGSPSYVREKYPTARVAFSKIKFGAIGTTFGHEGDEDGLWGNDRRLRSWPGDVHV